MATATAHDNLTVGQLIAQKPQLAPLLEQLGIDYCCGGKRPLDEVCLEHGLDPATVRAMLDAMSHTPVPAGAAAPDAMTLTELADHIEQTHHAYLRRQLPRLATLAAKVAEAHGGHYGWLHELRRLFDHFSDDLQQHMLKEEQILFPLIRRMEQQGPSEANPAVLACPITTMEAEHDEAGRALARFRELTSGYTTPPDGCASFRALLDGLAELERDMHQHVHKENNVLFPKAQQHNR